VRVSARGGKDRDGSNWPVGQQAGAPRPAAIGAVWWCE
jgi:hypothetical protein